MRVIGNPYINEIIEYDNGHPFQSCRMSRVGYKMVVRDGKYIVIGSEIKGNPGMSITNSIEYFAQWAARMEEIPDGKMVVIEHYDNNSYTEGREGETFDLVSFDKVENGRYSGPSWRRIEKSEVDELVLL